MKTPTGSGAPQTVAPDVKPQIKDEKSKGAEDRKYAIFSKDSIRTMAESAGYDKVSEETAAILAEDVCYRLREAVQVCVVPPTGVCVGYFVSNAIRRDLF